MSNEMGRTCSKCGLRICVYRVFVGDNLRERDHWEGPGVDGKIILK